MKRMPSIISCFLLCCCACALNAATFPVNPSFSLKAPDGTPAGWKKLCGDTDTSKVTFRCDSTTYHSAPYSCRIDAKGPAWYECQIYQQLSGSIVKGKKLTVKGWWKKSADPSHFNPCLMFFWVWVNNAPNDYHFIAAEDKTDWVQFNGSLSIPSNASSVWILFQMTGNDAISTQPDSRIWVDDIEVLVNDTSLTVDNTVGTAGSRILKPYVKPSGNALTFNIFGRLIPNNTKHIRRSSGLMLSKAAGGLMLLNYK